MRFAKDASRVFSSAARDKIALYEGIAPFYLRERARRLNPTRPIFYVALQALRCILPVMLRAFFSFCAAMIFVMGCSSRSSVTPPVNLQPGARIASGDHHEGGEILVWVTKDEGKQKRTFRLAAEGALRVLDEEEGIHIFTTRGELTWKAREKEVNLAGCDIEGGPGMPSKGTVTVVNLVNPSGDLVQKIVDPDAEGDELLDLQHHAELLGSVGPYLFISESSFMNACGPHGNEMMSAMIWDADSGKTIDLLVEIPGKDKLSDLAKRKIDEEENIAPDAHEDSDKPEPVQLVPVYSERGGLRIDAQLTRSACYSCSDHEWSSYTRSALLPTDWIPQRMQSWVMPPVVVKEFLEAHREWRLGGWSKR